jgi:sulfate permease, SulP family
MRLLVYWKPWCVVAANWFPFKRWLPELRQPGVVRADFMAGLTGAVVVLPQGMAFATLAGMPAQYGLYAAMVPCIIAALFGSSRLMVTGPANAISLMTLALIAPLAEPGSAAYVSLVLTLSFMVGVFQLALGLAKAGRFADLVPHSVIVGFTAGAAILIANSQVGPSLGLNLPRGQGVWANLSNAWLALGSIHWPSLGTALATILVIVLAKPLGRWVPPMFLGIVVVSIGVALMNAFGAGLGWTAPASVQKLPGFLPPLSMPDLSVETLTKLFVLAGIMTLLALTEALAIAKAMALRSGDTLNTNQEIVGQGLANLAGAFFSAYPASGSFNRSAVNAVSGARTPLSAVFASLLLVLILWVLAPWVPYIPLAAIAGLLMVVAFGLFDVPEIRASLRSGVAEFLPLVVTFVGTVTLSLEWAILLGIACALLVKKLRPKA